MSQHMDALNRATAARTEGARQRRALLGAPLRVLVPALVNPTPELGQYKLVTLFATGGPGKGLLPRVGREKLRSVLAQLKVDFPMGRNWHTELRLDELTDIERRRLVKALVRAAPKAWREAA